MCRLGSLVWRVRVGEYCWLLGSTEAFVFATSILRLHDLRFATTFYEVGFRVDRFDSSYGIVCLAGRELFHVDSRDRGLGQPKV